MQGSPVIAGVLFVTSDSSIVGSIDFVAQQSGTVVEGDTTRTSGWYEALYHPEHSDSAPTFYGGALAPESDFAFPGNGHLSFSVPSLGLVRIDIRSVGSFGVYAPGSDTITPLPAWCMGMSDTVPGSAWAANVTFFDPTNVDAQGSAGAYGVQAIDPDQPTFTPILMVGSSGTARVSSRDAGTTSVGVGACFV